MNFTRTATSRVAPQHHRITTTVHRSEILIRRQAVVFLQRNERHHLSFARSIASNSQKDDAHDDADDTQPTPSSTLIYDSPMGGMISRLKIVSITSCFLSLGVLPAVVTLKNLTALQQSDGSDMDFMTQLQASLPTMQQTSLGGLALFGATGSTLALHYVFGPYVLDMHKVSTHNSLDDDDSSMNSSPTATITTYQATTRSVFGWKKRWDIDPLSDEIEKYQGLRPFANVSVNGQPFYFHSEKILDEETRLAFFPVVENAEDEDEETSSATGQQQQQYREEGLPKGKDGKKKKEEDDDFW